MIEIKATMTDNILVTGIIVIEAAVTAVVGLVSVDVVSTKAGEHMTSAAAAVAAGQRGSRMCLLRPQQTIVS